MSLRLVRNPHGKKKDSRQAGMTKSGVLVMDVLVDMDKS
jgi:hypothetical protein